MQKKPVQQWLEGILREHSMTAGERAVVLPTNSSDFWNMHLGHYFVKISQRV